MKKIYALLAGAFVAVSAAATPFAAGPVSAKLTKMPAAEPMQFTQAPVMTISPNQAPDGVQRVIKDGRGNEWNMMIRNFMTCVDAFGMKNQQTGVPYTFEDFPFHLVLIAAQPSQNTVYQLYTIWPCVAYCDPECYTEDDSDIDWEKAATTFGSKEAAQAPCSIEQFRECAFWKQGESPIIPVLDGLYGIPSVVPVQGSAVIDGDSQSFSYKACTLDANTSQLGMQGGSYFLWDSYDPDYHEVSMNFNLAIGEADAQTGLVTTASRTEVFALSGDPVILGFIPLVYEIGELHIFNCGLTDIDTDYGMAYLHEYDAVNRYYLTWCHPSMSYMGVNQQQEVNAWDADRLSGGVLHGIQPIALTSSTGEYEFTFFRTALFAPAGEAGLENLTGKWTMPKPNYVANSRGEIDDWLSHPTPYELVPGYYDFGACDQDGFLGIIQGYSVYPEVELSFVGYGDKEEGFTFRYSSEGWRDNYILGSMTGEAYYHSDPGNFDTISMIPTIGNGDTNVLNTEGNSVEAVESNAPVVNTQYFNLQGQRMNVAPAHGIFIQRDIKADGTVKTMKVAR